MQIECYRNRAIEVKKVEKSKKDEGRKILCKELGLLKQADNTDCVKAEDYYPAMTKEELFVWQEFLPTFYSKNEKEWKKYDFDIIPTKAMEEISFAVSLGVFTDIEIWTPEEKIVDPHAVGLVGSRENKNITLHGITRWGESLRSFLEIKRMVLDKWQRNETKEKIPEKVQEYMDNYVMNLETEHEWLREIRFVGSAFFKSKCCKKEVYKFMTHYGDKKHLLCSKCGNVKIKASFTL